MTNLFAFSKDLDLWRNVARSFRDIYAEANDSDLLEWHVTISKFSNDNEYTFHFFILWHSGFPKIQPKISLLYGQRCMVESPNFFGNWVLLDKLSLYSITSVLLNLRNIVTRINTNNADVSRFNSQNCIYCHYAQKQEESNTNKDKLIKENNDSLVIVNEDKNNNGNLSVSNLSIASLTISNCTDHSVDTRITQLDKEIDTKKIILNDDINKEKITNDVIKPEKMIVKKQQVEKKLICDIPKPMVSVRKDAPEVVEKQKVPKPKVELKTQVVKAPKLESKPKVENKSIEIKSKVEINIKKNDKLKVESNKSTKKVVKKEKKSNKKVVKIEKEAVRYLEIDEYGSFVWKWTEGRRPNEGL